MDTRLINDSVQDFTTQLASRAPIPGGGGAAALCGALAAALCAMAGNLTVGKKKYAAFEADQQRMIARSEELRERFLALIEAAAAARTLEESEAILLEVNQKINEINPQVSLYQNQKLYACKANLKGINVLPNGYFYVSEWDWD